MDYSTDVEDHFLKYNITYHLKASVYVFTDKRTIPSKKLKCEFLSITVLLFRKKYLQYLLFACKPVLVMDLAEILLS